LGRVHCIRQMTPHAFCGAFELLALEGVEDRQVLLGPGLDPLEPGIAAVLDQSAQAVLLLYGLDQEGVTAEGGNDLVKRGVQVIDLTSIHRPAAAHLADEL
jgi:hypothetical protein